MLDPKLDLVKILATLLASAENVLMASVQINKEGIVAPTAGVTTRSKAKAVEPYPGYNLRLINQDDRCVWTASTDGMFTTSSAYDLLAMHGVKRTQLAHLWHPAFYRRTAIFAWNLLYRAVPVDSRISDQGVPMVSFKLIRWILPSKGLVLNVDGASKGNPGACGGGGCVRDCNGNLLFAFAHYYGFGSSLVAESRSLCDGLRLALEHAFNLAEIRSDSLTLVNSISSGKVPSWKCLHWWRDALSIIQTFDINIKHIYRQANQLADALANAQVIALVGWFSSALGSRVHPPGC
ncbi:hypothetical protein Taro_027882 [Colocasia esculenta]|uniref:RNase H type-1 domain-containing protein n=1 Tax=Colocasia esculenta TaxID=4460 RepID=A0A843VVL5_COLES|nr:hypothetical protein [Colocasia esculenta]